MAAVAALYVLVYVSYPIHLLEFAAHDDGLFLRQGLSIANGDWLGQYDNLTLAKGPGYPLFLALTHLTGLPISLTQAALQMSAVIIFAHSLGAICRQKWIGMIIMLAICFHPYLLSFENHRVFRDAIYWALCMGALGWLFHALTLDAVTQKKLYLFSLSLSGAFLSFAWITREETVWLLPAFLLVLGYIAGKFFIEKKIKSQLLALMVLSASSLLFILPIAALNYKTYGFFGIVDFKDSSYSKMIASINSVKVGERVPFVPAPIHVREEIAKQSPTYARFDRHLLPGGALFGWSEAGCPIYPSTCGEIAGGWYIWGIRDALAIEGAYDSFKSSRDIYQTIADEILDACNLERLTCEPGPLSFMPPLAQGQWNAFFPKFFDILKFALLFPGHDVSLATRDTPFESRDPQLYGKSLQLLNYPRTLDRNSKGGVLNMTGWFYKNQFYLNPRDSNQKRARPEFEITGLTPDGRTIVDRFERLASPDIADTFQDPEANFNRFSVAIDCRHSCVSLRAQFDSEAIDFAVPEKAGHYKLAPTITLYVDKIGYSGRLIQLSEPMHFVRDTLNTIRRIVYANFLWIILLVALASSTLYIFTDLLLKRTVSHLSVALAVLWGSVFTRSVLLTLVGISSFPVLNYYVAPIMFLLIPTIIIGLFAGLRCLSYFLVHTHVGQVRGGTA